jgi:SAM-dependent methyltransferase
VNGCDVDRCNACGIGRTHARGFDAATYYSEDYFTGGRDDGYADYQGTQPVLRSEFRRLLGHIRTQVSSGRLLEIGCAYGYFLDEAKKNFDVTGIEISETAVAACKASGLNVLRGDVSDASMRGLGMFDVIVMLDVIEHVPDPAEVMALCSRHLEPGGIVVLSTGDFSSLAARVTGPKWRLMTPPQHLWFFTPSSLRALARSSGLEVRSIARPWKLVPLSLIAYQLKRIAGLRLRGRLPDIGIPVNLFDAMRVVLRKPAVA